jgi:hypothetical protein
MDALFQWVWIHTVAIESMGYMLRNRYEVR